MSDFFNTTGLVLGAAITGGTPVLLATTGEVLSQRSGIVNLGLEGAMLLGAVAAAWTYHLTNSAGLAVLAGASAGALVGFAHALLVVSAEIGMIASGLCLFFIGRGLSAFWGYPLVGKQITGLSPLSIPVLSNIPLIGQAFFSQDIIVYLAAIFSCSMWYILFRTNAGLKVRAVGEDSRASYAKGISVKKVRVISVGIGAALAGIGGAHITLAFAHTWLEGLTGGRGWVAVGLVALARWNPIYALFVAYLFGGVMALQLNAQAVGVNVSPYLLSMLPYLLTVVMLVVARVWFSNSGIPAEIARNSS